MNNSSTNRHTPNDFPHINSHTGACMCMENCCQSASGCNCRACTGVGHENCGTLRPRGRRTRLRDAA